MPETPQIAPAHSNPAVARCCAPWDQVYQQARAQGKGDTFAAMDAGQIYRRNLPALDSLEAVRDFIACVAQGMLLGAIAGADGTRLIYAAQVADTSLRGKNRKQPAA